MEAPSQIVGSVIASKPAADLIDAFVAQVRRERAFVLARSAQGATIVRFNAPDAAIVALACRTLRGPAATVLRFGFAAGYKEQALAIAAGATGVAGVPGAGGVVGAGVIAGVAGVGGSAAAPDSPDLSARSVEQANELAAAANDGEVLVSPALATMLIEAGFALRSRQLSLPGGRTLAACVIELRADSKIEPFKIGTRDAGSAERHSRGLAPASKPPPAAPSEQLLGTAGELMHSLLAQAGEMARRQAEIEARQDALLARMTLVEEGSKPSLQMAALEAELQAQLGRVEERLDFIAKLEQRFTRMQSVASDIERRLGEQVRRRAEVDNLKALADTLVDQMVQAHVKLDALTTEQEAAQQRAMPLAEEMRALARSLEEAQRLLAGQAGRFAELESRGEALQRRLAELGDSDAKLSDMKAEIELIGELGAQGRADLQFLTKHEGEVAALIARIDALGARASEVEGQLQFVESRRETVEALRKHAEAATHLLGDLQVKLDILNEQRAVIDHTLEKLSRLDYSTQEAQSALRSLQRERELAERIERGIKALRARPVSESGG
jgi:chromosome segregation ATPase